MEYINLKVLWVSMAALFALMLMTAVNVVIRKAGIGGVADSLDLTRLLMVLIIFCAFAFQESKRGHIRVDMFLEKMPKHAAKITDTALNTLSTAVLALLAYAYFAGVSGSRRQGAATQVWRVPEWPFVAIVAVVISLFAVTMLLNTIDALINSPNDQNDDNQDEV